jgi:hypothetical protein
LANCEVTLLSAVSGRERKENGREGKRRKKGRGRGGGKKKWEYRRKREKDKGETRPQKAPRTIFLKKKERSDKKKTG